MTSNQQVALARRHGDTAANLNKNARQAIPAFLQKLYECVIFSNPYLDMVNNVLCF
jgi:hypothetical protein